MRNATYINNIPEADIVNSPRHYLAPNWLRNVYGMDGKLYLQALDVIKAWGLGFNLGNAVKYILRSGKKDPAKYIEDLKKAVFYINEEIAQLEEEAAFKFEVQFDAPKDYELPAKVAKEGPSYKGPAGRDNCC